MLWPSLQLKAVFATRPPTLILPENSRGGTQYWAGLLCGMVFWASRKTSRFRKKKKNGWEMMSPVPSAYGSPSHDQCMIPSVTRILITAHRFRSPISHPHPLTQRGCIMRRTAKNTTRRIIKTFTFWWSVSWSLFLRVICGALTLFVPRAKRNRPALTFDRPCWKDRYNAYTVFHVLL